MRPGQQKNRMRGRGRKGPNPLSRNYESNGPDVKIRGSAQHVAEKYAMLARDASAAGDRVMAENYLQHAEHYNRIIAAAQAQFQQPRDDRDTRDSDDDDDEDGYDTGNYSRNDMSDRNDRNDRDRRFQSNGGRDGGNGRDNGGRDNGGRDRNRDNNNQRGRDENGQRDGGQRRDRNNPPAGTGPQPVMVRDVNEGNAVNAHAGAAG